MRRRARSGKRRSGCDESTFGGFLLTPPANELGPVDDTLGPATREVKADLPGLAANDSALGERPELVQPSVYCRREQQAGRSHEQPKDREEWRERLERHARATLHGHKNGSREQRATREHDREW